MALTAQAQIIVGYKAPPSSKAINDKFAGIEPARILKGLSISQTAPGAYQVLAGTADDESIFLLPNGVLCKFTTATLGTTSVDLFAADGTYKLVLRLAWASDQYQQPTLEMLTPAQSLVATSDLLLARFVKVGIAVTIFENRPSISTEQPFPISKIASGLGIQQVIPFYFSTGQDAFGGGATRYAVLPAGSATSAKADLVIPFGFRWEDQGIEELTFSIWAMPEPGVSPVVAPSDVRLSFQIEMYGDTHGRQTFFPAERTVDLSGLNWIAGGGSEFTGRLFVDEEIQDLITSGISGGELMSVYVARNGVNPLDTYAGELRLFAGYINAPWRKLGE